MNYKPFSDNKNDYLTHAKQQFAVKFADFDTGRTGSGFGSSSLESLRESIDDINQLIESRKDLNCQMIKDMEKVEVDINNFLNMQQNEMPKEQLMLFKEKSIELSESKRNEMLNCWRDIARLKEELRGYQREMTEKESRMSMLDSILSE